MRQLLGKEWGIEGDVASLSISDSEKLTITIGTSVDGLLLEVVENKNVTYKVSKPIGDVKSVVEALDQCSSEKNITSEKLSLKKSIEYYKSILSLQENDIEEFVSGSYLESPENLYSDLLLINSLRPDLYQSALYSTAYFAEWLKETNHEGLKKIIMPVIESLTGENFKESVLDQLLVGGQGIQLKSKQGTERYAILSDDAAEPGFVRATYFNETGITGHDSRFDYSELLDLLYKEGFDELSPGMLEQLSVSSSFKKGFELNRFFQEKNSEISAKKLQESASLNIGNSNEEVSGSIHEKNNSPSPVYEKDPHKAFELLSKEYGECLKDFRTARNLPKDAYFISSGENNQRYTLRTKQDGFVANLTESPEFAIRTALKRAAGGVVYFNPDLVLGKIERTSPKNKVPVIAEVAPVVDGEIMMGFGKYSNKTIEAVYQVDPGYIEWLNKTTISSGTKDFKATIKHYGNLLDLEKSEINKIPADLDLNSIKRDLASRNIIIEKTSKDINVYGLPFAIGSELMHKAIHGMFEGAFYNKENACWKILQEYVADADIELRAFWLVDRLLQGMTDRREIKVSSMLKDTLDKFEDGSEIYKVGENVSSLIKRGADLGIPKNVLDNQIDDIGRALTAYEKGKPAFLLSNEPGTGKTFVLGGIIEELKRQHNEDNVFYLTMSQDLIEQIKKDLKSFDIGHVKFITYSALGNGEVTYDEGAIVLADEAHNLLNTSSNRGIYGQALLEAAKFVIPASATAMENPVQAQYLEATGIFNKVGGFQDWVTTFGGIAKTFYGNTTYSWGGELELAKRSRDWFLNQGVMTQRKMTIPESQIKNSYKDVKVAEKWVDLYEKINSAYESALRDEAGEKSLNYNRIKEHSTNTLKRVLESAKVDAAIAAAKDAIKRGRNPIVFVETKADRHIGRFRLSGSKPSSKLYDFSEMEYMMSEWKVDRDIALSMGDSVPSPPFAGFIYDIAEAFNQHGLDYELPSIPKEIKAAFPRGSVAEYTGAVAASKATKNLADWKEGRKKVLIATMAKGGTGQSYHDTVGDHPTTQIVINLPWASRVVDQVAGRTVRYGMIGLAELDWLFSTQLEIENKLIDRVAKRMADLGASVNGVDHKGAERIKSLQSKANESNAAPWLGVDIHRPDDFYGYKIALTPKAKHLALQKNESREVFVKKVYNQGEFLDVSDQPHGDSYRINEKDYSIEVLGKEHSLQELSGEAAIRFYMELITESNAEYKAVDAVVPLKFEHNGSELECIAQYGKSVPLSQAKAGVKTSIYIKKLALSDGSAGPNVVVQSFKLNGRDVMTEIDYDAQASDERLEQFRKLGLNVPVIPSVNLNEENREKDGQSREISEPSDVIPQEVTDVGEYIPGAVKDKFKNYLKALDDSDVDLLTTPLSKTLPHPDYEKLNDTGVPKEALALVSILRAEIPRKTQRSGQAWANKVKEARRTISNLIKDRDYYPLLMEAIISTNAGVSKDIVRTLRIFDSLPLGMYKDAGKYRIKQSRFSYFKGREYDEKTKIYYLSDERNNTTDVGGDDLEEVVEQASVAIQKRLSEKTKEKSKGPKLSVFRDTDADQSFVGYKGGQGVVNLRFIPQEIAQVNEKYKYIKDNYDDLVREFNARKNVVARHTENRERVGPSINSQGVTVEDKRKKFGLKAVQWGNTTLKNQKEAQQRLTQAYEALTDLSLVLDIPPAAVGLDGTLSLAFGARGKGGLGKSGGRTLASYDLKYSIINLTRSGGAGNLAHEWFHALDNYLVKSLSGNTQQPAYRLATGSKKITPTKLVDGEIVELNPLDRADLLEAIEAVKKSVEDNEYHEYAKDLDGLFSRKEAYWSSSVEKTARAFERYVKDKLAEKGIVNDYLVNINESPDGEGGVYPSASQMKDFGIERSFDLLLKSLNPIKTEFGTALYRIEDDSELLLGAWVDACSDDSLSRNSYSPSDLELMLEGMGLDVEKDTSSIKVFGDEGYINIVDENDQIRIETNGFEPEEKEAGEIFRGILDYCQVTNKTLKTLSVFNAIDSNNELLLSSLKHGGVSHILSDSTSANVAKLLMDSYKNVIDSIPELKDVTFDPALGNYQFKNSAGDLSVRLVSALNNPNESERDLLLGLIEQRLPSSSRHLVNSATLKRTVILQEYIARDDDLLNTGLSLLTAASHSNMALSSLYKKERGFGDSKFNHAELVSDWIKPTSEHTGVQVNVVATASDLPKHLAKGIGKNTPGVYDVKRMQPYVIADRIKGKAHAIKVALHEGIGHLGFISFLERNALNGGDRVADVLEGIYKGVGEREIAKATMAYGFDLKSPNDRKEAVLEYVALMAELGQKPIEVNQVVNASKDMIDGLYDDEIVWTRNDILGLLEASRLHSIIEKSKESGTKLTSEQIEKIQEVKATYENLLEANGGRLKRLLGRDGGIITWHGSPTLFSSFDISKVNTGEGAQHEGWGLYSAGQKDIAKDYERILTSGSVETDIGVRADWDVEDALEDDPAKLMAFKLFQESGRNWGRVKSTLENDDVNKDILAAASDLEDKIKPIDRGYLYQLELKVGEQDLALWDQPMSAQSEVVQEFFNQYRDEIGYEKTLAELLSEWKPGYLDEVARNGGDPEAVSDAFDVICFENEYQEDAWDVINSNPSFFLDPNDVYDLINRADTGPSGMKFMLSDAVLALEDIGASNSPQESTALMLAAGIKGISYRYSGLKSIDPTLNNTNYVIFDASLINIISTEHVARSQKAQELRKLLGIQAETSLPRQVDKSNYIALDKVISEQSASVVAVLQDFKKALKIDGSDTELLAEQVYTDIIEKVFSGNELEASDYLFKKGVDGLKLITGYYKLTPTYEEIDFSLATTVINSPSAARVNDNAGLSMDKESRAARAELLGFDTETIFFHGSSEEFDAFDDRLNTHYFTTRPEYGYIKNSKNVYPVYLKMENTYQAKTQSEIEMLRSVPERVEELKRLGFDSVAWNLPGNLNKGGSGWGNDYPQFVVFNSNQIKSINAKFNLLSDHAGILQKLNADEYLSSENRKIRAKQLGYETDNVFYHGSTMSFETLTPNSISSMIGRGVYLTTSPEDASKYASVDPFINHDLPAKAEHLSSSLGITYDEAKDYLRVNDGSVTPCYLKEGKYLTITHEGMSHNGQRMHTFNNAKGLQIALFADVENAEEFLKNLDRVVEGGSKVKRLVENITGKVDASKGEAIMGLMREYKAYGFIREIAVTLNCDYIKLGEGIAPKAPEGAEHVISLNGASDIRSINARFDLKSKNSELLLAKIEARTPNPQFNARFANSVVTKDGVPLVVYRGQHGDANHSIRSRFKAISFSNSRVASEYAVNPNIQSDKVSSSHVIPAYLKIEKPFIRNEDDPFIDMQVIAENLELSQEQSIEIALLFKEAIEQTDNYEELAEESQADNLEDLLKNNPAIVEELYFDSYHFFDNDYLVERMVEKGFDGAIHIGNGTSSDALEYKVFSEDQVIPKLDYPNVNHFSSLESRVGKYLNAEVQQINSDGDISVKNLNLELTLSLENSAIPSSAISAYGFNAAGLKIASVRRLTLLPGKKANAKDDLGLLANALKAEGFDTLLIEGSNSALSSNLTAFYSPGDLEVASCLVKSLSTKAIESLPVMPRFLFAGEKSEVNNQSTLELAKSLSEACVSEKDIWDQTSWYKGVDDNWRYEINDSDITLDETMISTQINRVINGDNRQLLRVTKLSTLIKHDKLFEAYPGLIDFRIFMLNGGSYSKVQGSADNEKIILNLDEKSSVERIKYILLHEVQHVIQRLEGFAIGSNLAEAEQRVRKVALEKLDKSEYKKADSELDVIRSEMRRYGLMSRHSHLYSLAHNDNATRQASKFYNSDDYALNANYVIDKLGLPPKKHRKHEHNQWLQGAALLICGVLEREFEKGYTLSLVEEKAELEADFGKNAVKNKINQLNRKFTKIHTVLLNKHDAADMLRRLDSVVNTYEESSYKLYNAAAGEVESRLVEARFANNDYQSFPMDMIDVPASEQFVFTERDVGRIAKSLNVDANIFQLKDTASDLPGHIRNSIPKNSQIRVSGVAFANEIFIVKDQIKNQQDLEKTIVHECSHIGVGQVFGKETEGAYGAFWVAAGRKDGLLRKAKAMGCDLTAYADWADEMLGKSEITSHQRVAMLVDEFVAHASANKNYSSLAGRIKVSLGEFLGGIREGLRSIGLKGLSTLKSSDIFYLCRQVNNAARNTSASKKPFFITPKSPTHQQYSWELEVMSQLKTNKGLSDKECVQFAEKNEEDMNLGFNNKIQPEKFAEQIGKGLRMEDSKKERFTSPSP